MKERAVPTCIRAEADQRMIARQFKAVQRFSEQLDAQAIRWSSAGNPVRARILFVLQNERELCPCDISDILGMSVPGVSQHLKRLKEAGLVQGRRDGVMILYTLSEAGQLLADEIDMINNPELARR